MPGLWVCCIPTRIPGTKSVSFRTSLIIISWLTLWGPRSYIYGLKVFGRDDSHLINYIRSFEYFVRFPISNYLGVANMIVNNSQIINDSNTTTLFLSEKSRSPKGSKCLFKWNLFVFVLETQLYRYMISF
jgi:hypothetical protein